VLPSAAAGGLLWLRCARQTHKIMVHLANGAGDCPCDCGCVHLQLQQEKKPKNCAVSDSARQFIGSIVSRCGGLGHELNRNRLDSLGWRVFICVRF
jgi:hypothetical protein